MRPNFPENAAPLIDINMVDPNASKALAILGKSLNLLGGRYFPGGTKATQTMSLPTAISVVRQETLAVSSSLMPVSNTT